MELRSDRWWTTSETAFYLNLKPSTLKKWRTRNQGPPYNRIGAAIRYSPATVKAWAESRGRERHLFGEFNNLYFGGALRDYQIRVRYDIDAGREAGDPDEFYNPNLGFIEADERRTGFGWPRKRR